MIFYANIILVKKMNKYLSNFEMLFSNNKERLYKALLEKKDWINSCFYSEYSFDFHRENDKEIYDDLFSLLNNSLLLKNDKSDKYSYRYFFETLRYPRKEGTFIVKFDFRKMDIKCYKELFANFYHCIEENEKIDFKDETMNELENMMVSDKDYVLILDKQNLINNAYPLNAFLEIIYDKEFIDDLKYEALKEISESLSIKLTEHKNG